MKKFAMIICMLVASIGAANAQFEKGVWFINPSVSGVGFSYSKAEKAKFGFSVEGGSFLMDNVALLVQLGADWSKPVDTYDLSAGGRYYFEQTGVYVGANLGFTSSKYKYSGDTHAWGLGVECGYAFFLSHTVTLEPAVYYKWRFNDCDQSKFGIRLGFGIYL
jgi:hypothetical protein